MNNNPVSYQLYKTEFAWRLAWLRLAGGWHVCCMGARITGEKTHSCWQSSRDVLRLNTCWFEVLGWVQTTSTTVTKVAEFDIILIIWKGQGTARMNALSPFLLSGNYITVEQEAWTHEVNHSSSSYYSPSQSHIIMLLPVCQHARARSTVSFEACGRLVGESPLLLVADLWWRYHLGARWRSILRRLAFKTPFLDRDPDRLKVHNLEAEVLACSPNSKGRNDQKKL